MCWKYIGYATLACTDGRRYRSFSQLLLFPVSDFARFPDPFHGSEFLSFILHPLRSPFLRENGWRKAQKRRRRSSQQRRRAKAPHLHLALQSRSGPSMDSKKIQPTEAQGFPKYFAAYFMLSMNLNSFLPSHLCAVSCPPSCTTLGLEGSPSRCREGDGGRKTCRI